MEKQGHRTLLPASGAPLLYSREIPESKMKRKRSHITRVACNACRAKKWGCDGGRPICTPCRTRNLDCVYVSIDESETPAMALKRENEALRERMVALDDLLNHLRYMPEDVAQALFLRLRTTASPTTILQSLSGSILRHQSLEERKVPVYAGSLHSEVEHGFTARHPIVYPTLGLLEDEVLARSPLLNSTETPQMEHQLGGATTTSFSNREGLHRETDTFPVAGTKVAHASECEAYTPCPRTGADSDSPGTRSSTRLCDPRLSHLDIAFWTTVQVSDHFASGAISLYLETDHPILALFDSRLFISDLVEKRLRFCSSFLVNSLLSFACQAYAAKDPEASARSHEFEREAEKLWGETRTTDALPTIPGLLLLFLSRASHGRGEVGREYLEEVYEMAKRMKLFGVLDAMSARNLSSLSLEYQRAVMYTAWGAFNGLTLQTLFYLATPPQYPPLLPIPRHVKKAKPEGDNIGSQIIVHDEMEQSFPYFCSFWKIACEVLFAYRSTKDSPTAPLDFAMTRYHELLSSADKLADFMTRSENNSAHTLVFHMWFHAIILDIFRPFLVHQKPDDSTSWSESIASPAAISAASVKQLKRLMLMYRRRQQSAAYSIFWHVALLYVANAVLKDTRDPEWRFYFQMCIHGYQGLFSSFEVVKGINQGLLAMAVNSSAISSSEAHLIIQEFRSKGHDRRTTERMSGGCMVDLDLAVRDSDAARVDTLIEKFEEMTSLDEFTEGIV